MYSKKNIYKKFLIYTTIFGSNIVHGFDLAKFAKICAGFGAACAAVGAAAAGVDWLMTLTDDKLIEKVKNDLNDIIEHNKDYVTLFKKHLNWDRYSLTVRREVLNTFSECFLYDIAFANDTKYGQPLPTIVVQDNSLLEGDVKLLLQRIDDIQSRRVITEQERYNLGSMRLLLEQALVMQEELLLLKDYLTKHVSYFNLAQCGWLVNKAYNVDFELYNLYKFDQYNLLQSLDPIIYKKYNYTHFAYIAYAEDIDVTINKLLSARNHAAFNYSSMIAWVNQCIDQLKRIRIVIENRYQLQLLERDRLHIAQHRIVL